MLKLAVILAHFGQPWCCDERDCKPAQPSEVRIVADGYAVGGPKGVEVVPFDHRHIYPSEDGRFWVCRYHDGSVRCIFKPETGT